MTRSTKLTLMKAISYRCAAFVLTTIIALIVTGDIKSAAAIGVGEFIVKVGAYYVHERAWNKLCKG